MYNIDTAELHVGPDIDVGESAVYSFFSVLRSNLISPKLYSTKGARASKLVTVNEDDHDGPLQFYGLVDITADSWKDGHNKCWRGLTEKIQA